MQIVPHELRRQAVLDYRFTPRHGCPSFQRTTGFFLANDDHVTAGRIQAFSDFGHGSLSSWDCVATTGVRFRRTRIGTKNWDQPKQVFVWILKAKRRRISRFSNVCRSKGSKPEGDLKAPGSRAGHSRKLTYLFSKC